MCTISKEPGCFSSWVMVPTRPMLFPPPKKKREPRMVQRVSQRRFRRWRWWLSNVWLEDLIKDKRSTQIMRKLKRTKLKQKLPVAKQYNTLFDCGHIGEIPAITESLCFCHAGNLTWFPRMSANHVLEKMFPSREVILSCLKHPWYYLKFQLHTNLQHEFASSDWVG